jgi:uncharacterized repeat protein (TIGR01451 family)
MRSANPFDRSVSRHHSAARGTLTRIAFFVVAFAFTGMAMAQTAALSVMKIATPEPVAAGNVLTYLLTVSNEGPDDAASVSLADTLPSGVTFLALNTPAGWSCTTPAVGGTGTVTCTIATLPPGTTEFELQTTVDALPNGTAIDNTSAISSTTGDPSASDNTATVTSHVSSLSADITLTKSGAPDPVTAGNDLVYTLTASNDTPAVIDTFTMTDVLPSDVTFNSLVPAAGWSCTTPAVGASGTVTCSINGFPPTTSASFTLSVKVDPARAAGALVNQASLFADSGGRQTTVIGSSSVETDVAADLQLVVTDAPDPVTPGQPIAYSIALTNNGPSFATSITLAGSVPTDTTFVSLVAPGGWSCTTPAVGGTGAITCTAAALGLTTSNFTLNVLVAPVTAPGSIITNTVTATSPSDTSQVPDQATNTTTVGSAIADLSVGITDAPDPVTAGSNIVYTITVSNAGPSNAPTATLSDTLPAGTTFVSLAAPAWTCSTPAVGGTGNVSCLSASLAPGNSIVTLTVNTSAALPDQTIITNIATVSSPADSNNANDSASTTTTVNLNPATTTTINAPTITYNANGIVTVTVSAPGVTPTGNVSLSVDGGAPLTQLLSPVAASNPPAASATFTLPSPSGGTHTLTATYPGQNGLNGSAASGSLLVNPAATTTGVVPSPSSAVTGQSITLTATVTSPAGTPTGTVQFRVDGTNAGAPVALSSGQAIRVIQASGIGSHTIDADYSGDANFLASTGASSFTVGQASTTITITSNLATPSVPQQPVAISFNLAVTAPGSGTPTGTVTISDGQGHSCTAVLPATSCSITFPAAGDYLITATYPGDANYSGSASSAVAHAVIAGTNAPTLDGGMLLFLLLTLGAAGFIVAGRR